MRLTEGDLVMINQPGGEHDRVIGRVVQAVTVAAVTVRLPYVGERHFAMSMIVPVSRTEPAGGVPEVGDMVEIREAFPELGVERGQLGRVLELGLMPRVGLHAGFRVETVGKLRGQRVRGWVTLDQIHRLPKVHTDDNGRELAAARRRVAAERDPATAAILDQPKPITRLTFHVKPEDIQRTKDAAAKAKAEGEAKRLKLLEELKAKAASEAKAKAEAGTPAHTAPEQPKA